MPLTCWLSIPLNGMLYQQVNGIAIISPLGPLMANKLLCPIKEKLERDNKIPEFYKRYVEDSLAKVQDLVPAVTAFLLTLI